MKPLLVSIVIGLFLLSGCYYDSKEFLFPTLNTICTDTISPVIYDGAISKILNDNCVTCHNTLNPHGNAILDSYSNVKTQVDNGQLLGSILHTSGFTGSKAMPPSGSLDDCSINAIKKWISIQSPQK